jgi:SAM-dependent MidA family methyltransferase
MIQQQKQRLASPLREDKVRWVVGLDDPVFAGGIVGFVVSNELLDAFPVHRVVKQGGGLWEVYVTLKEGRLTEVLGAPSTPRLIQYFERLGLDLTDGHQAEVNLRALDWIRQVGSALNRGVVITIDYGYPAAELYSQDRPRGTFLCYYKHRVSENPYVRVGRQDMTAHVDFTSLALTGREAGLQVLGFTTQEYFLIGLGIDQEMEARLASHQEDQARERELAALKHLISPTGPGKVFKILIQGKGLEGLELGGLNYRPFAAETLFSL